ncbi:hypothetical protein PFISCL1PPCAC_21491, partial [Pristionchus fissidentatus]
VLPSSLIGWKPVIVDKTSENEMKKDSDQSCSSKSIKKEEEEEEEVGENHMESLRSFAAVCDRAVKKEEEAMKNNVGPDNLTHHLLPEAKKRKSIIVVAVRMRSNYERRCGCRTVNASFSLMTKKEQIRVKGRRRSWETRNRLSIFPSYVNLTTFQLINRTPRVRRKLKWKRTRR